VKLSPAHLLATLTGSIALLLGGCASAPNVDIDHAAAARIKRIAILGVPEPANIEAANLGGTASAFGLIGGLVQGSNNVDRAKKFTATLKQQNFSPAESLLHAMEQSLKAQGFDVVIVRDQKPKLSADGKSDDFSGIHVDADAFLAAWFGVDGYVSQPFSTHFEPWVLIKAHLLDATSKHELYFKTFVVGWKMKIDNAVFLSPDPKFQFGSFDDLIAQAPLAASGLNHCNELAAQKVGADLKSQ
jgi:hypothetical protein